MLGGMWGFRPWLAGMACLSGFGNQRSSRECFRRHSQSFDYDGLTQMALQLDTQRAFGFYGGTFNISAFRLWSHLSADNLGTFKPPSGIKADRATRLWELWYDQKFLDQDRMDVKIGQQSLDQEFMGSQNADLFVNTMFGWPMVPSADPCRWPGLPAFCAWCAVTRKT